MLQANPSMCATRGDVVSSGRYETGTPGLRYVTFRNVAKARRSKMWLVFHLINDEDSGNENRYQFVVSIRLSA
jgi:hypothetical protein